MTNDDTAFDALALLEIIDTLNQISQDAWDSAAQALGLPIPELEAAYNANVPEVTDSIDVERVYQSREVVVSLCYDYDLNLSVHHVLDVVDDFNAKSRDLFARVSQSQGLTRDALIDRYHQDDEAILDLIQPMIMHYVQEGVTILLAISEQRKQASQYTVLYSPTH